MQVINSLSLIGFVLQKIRCDAYCMTIVLRVPSAAPGPFLPGVGAGSAQAGRRRGPVVAQWWFHSEGSYQVHRYSELRAVRWRFRAPKYFSIV